MPSLRLLTRLAQGSGNAATSISVTTRDALSAYSVGALSTCRSFCSAAPGAPDDVPGHRREHPGPSQAGQAGTSGVADNSTSTSSTDSWAEGGPGYQYGNEEADDSHDSQYDRERALKRVLRSSNAAELAAVHYFRGLQCGLRGRPDAAGFADQEAGAAEGLRGLLPSYRVRPSLAQGPLSLACMALGAAAGLAPPRLRLAVSGAVGDALAEHFNEQLRQLNEAGAAAQAPDVRAALRSLRDLPRTPEGAPPAPDLVSVLQEGIAAAASGGGGGGPGGPGGPTVLSGVAGAVREWGVEGTVGAVVKAGTRVALEAAARL